MEKKPEVTPCPICGQEITHIRHHLMKHTRTHFNKDLTNPVNIGQKGANEIWQKFCDLIMPEGWS